MYEHLTDEQLERLIAQKWKEVSDERNQAQKKNPPIPSHIRMGYSKRTPPEIRRLEEEQQRRIRQKEKNQQLKTLLIIAGVISLILYFVLG